ncbi:hypothetical protein ACIP2X_38075 [Streptomyces sp. NPDC089424]|uniref:hypothetical protein n=1 Tax=Streptomyces sp. NPDC089424 TaxID=3365917 RepID=UPI00380F0F8F
MGALNLVPNQTQTEDPKWKTKGGGGGGESFASLAHQIYQDDRADGPSRELLLAFAYVITTRDFDTPKEMWRQIRKALSTPHPNMRYSSRDRVTDLISHDAPRYVRPDERPGGYDPTMHYCVGPRLRPFKERPYYADQLTLPERVAQDKRDAEDFRNTDNVCGADGKHKVLEKLPGTGWYKWHWFCDRHRADAQRVTEQVKAQNAAAPDPIPNQGGLLPCYFDADWVGLYKHYVSWWEPPVYGVRADDWPIPGKQPVPQRARLSLVIGGSDREGE